jgi:FlaA1/EpsC-like NDP-sugar epimerase
VIRSSAPPPVELLLGRPEFSGNLLQAARVARGRRVLITGAAGSIGVPLTHLVAEAEPDRLVLLDHHEHSLFSLERALLPTMEAQLELADIRDRVRIERIFDTHQPEVVIHLAAAKHVPYGERFPDVAVATNVLATATLLDLARRAETAVFVYPSSDKSVQPPSVYGATKRLAEALVQSAAGERRWAVVRYVNIIGTRGSVIENFTHWILEDHPLRVTDAQMTRYWISMDEAIWCLLNLASCASPGEVVMPACGEPLPIVDTAQRLAGWYRPDHVPYPMTCVGSRPGERLHEVLLSRNESFVDSPESVQGLRSVRTTRDAASVERVHEIIARLVELVDRGDRQTLKRLCLEAADALQ